MKKILLATILFAVTFVASTQVSYAAPTKQQKRVAYTIKNLKLDASTTRTLQPMLMQYLTDLKAAQKPYDDLKEKYKTDIKNGTLTDKAANALLEAKWKSAKDEIAVKESYEKKFRTLLSAKKVFICFDLLNDKMSKIEGKASGSQDDEEED